MPTELGEIVHESVKEYFPEIIDVDFTVNMETLLDKVADGEIEWKKVIDMFYENFKIDVARAEEEMEKIEIKDEPAGEDCELCGSPMVYKMGRYGKFMACSNFPDCRNTKAIIKTIGVKCLNVKREKLSNVNLKRIEYSMVVQDTQNVIIHHGINL